MEFFKESEKIINFNVNKCETDIKKFLGKQNLSSRLFRRLYKNKHIYVNGEFRRKGLEISKGEIVSIYMEDEENTTNIENMNIDIVYEDFDLLIINKKPDTVVHLTRGHQEKTLSNGVAYYFKENNINRKIRFVNRLDKDTSGLVIVAKNQFAHQQMALQFQLNQVERKYLAIVNGLIEKNQDYINGSIERETEGSMKRIVRDSGQESLSKYIVKKRYLNESLVEIQIFTGRPHQIRVHLSHIGHPILGDTLYGMENNYINRQALHSYYLKIRQPRTKKQLEITIPLPKDIESLKNNLK